MPPLVRLFQVPDWFSCHWYVGAVPVAVIENEVFAPAQMVELEGPTLTPGTVLNVNVAADEVADGVQVPDTTQRY